MSVGLSVCVSHNDSAITDLTPPFFFCLWIGKSIDQKPINIVNHMYELFELLLAPKTVFAMFRAVSFAKSLETLADN